jgi:hypothetical protein
MRQYDRYKASGKTDQLQPEKPDSLTMIKVNWNMVILKMCTTAREGKRQHSGVEEDAQKLST